MCLSVCLSVREHISGATCAIFTKFFMHICLWPWLGPPPAGLRNPKGTEGQFWGFSSPLTMHCNAFAAKGIIPYRPGRQWRECTARVKCMIYDCLVVVRVFYCRILFHFQHEVCNILVDVTQLQQRDRATLCQWQSRSRWDTLQALWPFITRVCEDVIPVCNNDGHLVHNCRLHISPARRVFRLATTGDPIGFSPRSLPSKDWSPDVTMLLLLRDKTSRQNTDSWQTDGRTDRLRDGQTVHMRRAEKMRAP